MIQIYLNNIDDICLNHYSELEIDCKNKISFIIKVLEIFISGKNVLLKKISKSNLSSIPNIEYIETDFHLNSVKPNLNLISDITKQTIILKTKKTEDIEIYSSKSNLKSDLLSIKSLFEYLEINLKKILTSRCSEFEKIESDSMNIFNFMNYGEIKHLVKWIFDYDEFISKKNRIEGYNAYSLAKNLSVNVCPYCNRLYTNTVISQEELIRPTFDHFYSQSDHPLFSLSFYNLIPSCSICNSTLKGDTEFNSKTHINPFDEGFNEDAKFILSDRFLVNISTDQKDKNEGFLVEINNLSLDQDKKKRIDLNIEIFRLNEIYQSHIDIAEEIYNKIANYYDIIFTQDTLSELNLSTKEQVYEFYLSNKYSIENFQNRPLSKFSKDIFDFVLSKGFAKEFKNLK